MEIPNALDSGPVPGEVEVRPVRGVGEQRLWDGLAREHRYLPFHSLFGKSLRHVAVWGDIRVALPGWTAGAFKVGARDAWIGWSPEQQFSRLHPVASNTRFAVPAERGQVPSLASRILAPGLRRLSSDMRERHGFPVLLAETFVDPSRFEAICCRASNWRRLGLAKGFSRLPGGAARWRRNGQPKEIYARELEDGARQALRAERTAPEWRADAKAEPMPAEELRSPRDYLQSIPDFRKRRGQRCGIACYTAIMIAARPGGYRGVAAFGEYAARLDEEQPGAVGAFWSPSRRRFTAPATSTFHYVLSSMPPDALETALREWIDQSGEAGAPVALDGKDVRGASKQIEGERRMMAAAVEHGSGLVLGQARAGSKTSEIPAVRQLSRDLSLEGRIVTLDALHAQRETARRLVKSCGADYVTAAAEDSQPTIRKDLEDLDWAGAAWGEDKVDKGRGRVETRRCAAFDLSDPKWNGKCKLQGRKQAFRIERTRHVRKSGKTGRETACGSASLEAGKAGADAILSLAGDHWHIENRLHCARDSACDEDRCRARVRRPPRNLACSGNAAISIVRPGGEFKYIPEASRHYAAKTRDALDAALKAARP